MNKKLIAAVAGVFLLSANAFASQINVTVTDSSGNPVPGTQIVLVNFENMTDSHVGYADTGGAHNFSSVTDGETYGVFVSSQGWNPPFLEQINSDYPPEVTAEESTVEEPVTLSPVYEGDMDKYCVVEATVTVSSPTVVFGGIGNSTAEGDVAMGAAYIDSYDGQVTTGRIRYYNVPNDLGGEYYAGVFSPLMNKHIDGTVESLAGQTGIVSAPGLDLTSEDAVEPDNTDSSVETADKLIFRGVVSDDSGAPLRDAEVRIEYGTYTATGDWVWDSFTSWTDSDGVYRVYSDTVPPAADFTYSVTRRGHIGTSTVKSATFESYPVKENFLLGVASGELRGKLYLGTTDYVIPEGHVNVYGDHTYWSVDGSSDPANLVKDEPYAWDDANIGWDGVFKIDNLPSGNYIVDVWSDFSEESIKYNNGINGEEDVNWGSPTDYEGARQVGGDDLRITVWTSSFSVFTSTGGDVTSSKTDDAGNLLVELEPKEITSSSTATITGTLNLLSGDEISESSPVTLIVGERWDTYQQDITTSVYSPAVSEGTDVYVELDHDRVFEEGLEVSPTDYNIISYVTWGDETSNSRVYWDDTVTQPADGENLDVTYTYENPVPPVRTFEKISGTGTTFPFNVTVEKGKSYRLEIRSLNYGPVYKMGQRDILENIDMTDKSTEEVGEIDINPSGQIKGYVQKPDGNYFKPVNKKFNVGTTDYYRVETGMDIEAVGTDIDSWGYSKVYDDGSFRITGLLPGTYRLKTNTRLWIDVDWDRADAEQYQQDMYAKELQKIPWAEVKKEYTVEASTVPKKIKLNLEGGVDVAPHSKIKVDIKETLFSDVTGYFY
ncbi:MAG: carboxypeptidase-like regulatory domain-containing protein, partial [Elusimicrobiota bacterium]